MPGTVQDLTNTLLTSIDSEGNVKDMTLLLSVIKELETAEITAEDLKVTRLGKFINLIRRKLADVDKKLSKRLKKLVKHWLQLVPPKLPNGAAPSIISSLSITPTFDDASDKGRKSASLEPDVHIQVTNNGHSHLLSSTRVMSPHPSSLVQPHSPVRPESFSQSSGYGSNVGSMESDSSQEIFSHPMANHVSVVRHSASPTPPPASPTPSYNTASSRPNQPVSVNPTRNRSNLVHKLSGFKRNLSPNKDLVANNSLQSTSSSKIAHVNTTSDTNQHSLHNSSSSNSNSLPSIASSSHQSILPQPSSPLFSPGINIAIDSFSGETSPAAWTSKQAEFFQAPDFSKLSDITGTIPGNTKAVDTLNGIGSKQFLNVLNSSRKRQRSDSPLSNKSTSPHKRHKKHKHNSAGKTSRHVEELVVSVPLSKVVIRNSPRNIQTSHIIKNRSPDNRTKEVGQLVVKIDRSVLNMIQAQAKPLKSPTVDPGEELVLQTVYPAAKEQAVKSVLATACHPVTEQTSHVRQARETRHSSSSSSSSNGSESLPQSPNDQSIHQQLQQEQHQNQSVGNNTHDPNTSPAGFNTLAHSAPTRQPNSPLMTDAEFSGMNGKPECPVERNIPADAIPGVNGCIGSDGNWYTWEEHIPGNGIEVTVLPYVFIDM